MVKHFLHCEFCEYVVKPEDKRYFLHGITTYRHQALTVLVQCEVEWFLHSETNTVIAQEDLVSIFCDTEITFIV